MKDPVSINRGRSFVLTSLLLVGLLMPVIAVGNPDAESKQKSSSKRKRRVSTGSSAAGSGLTGDEIDKLVREHNRLRADVGVEPVTWSADLAAYAQSWANNLAQQGCELDHRPASGQWKQIYGENLFMGTASGYRVEDAVKSWEEEKANYRGGPLNNSNWQDAGHYTQVVWRATTQIGCAKVNCRDNLIVVCNYNPRGNTLGQKAY